MPFGNKNDQNKSAYTWTFPNNFCGGFAVHAVLEDKFPNLGKTPLDIYRGIQAAQQIDHETSPNSANMLLGTLQSGQGTAMSLPSSMCNVLARYELTVFVGYTATFRGSQFPPGMFEEEVKKIDTLGSSLPILKGEYDSLPLLEAGIGTYSYHIVLANGGTHWVAIKKMPGQQYELYNPGGGKCTPHNAFEDALKAISGMLELMISIP